MTERLWDYRIVSIVRVVDGDTYDLVVEKTMDFGFRLVETKRWATRFRLLGLDTPETNQAGGAAATQFAETWLKNAVYSDVLRGQTEKTDNFGRWLIDPYRVDTGERLSEALAAAGHVKPA